ncbi:MAG: hypothetical protein OK454_06705, partial [Thaumarchaeota archaeon]|nr:hypothetical protein [Nitrososphaerota archaeon]
MQHPTTDSSDPRGQSTRIILDGSQPKPEMPPPGGGESEPPPGAGLGGQLDLEEGPEPSGDLEPSLSSLRAEILEKVGAYARQRWTPQKYVPGKTPAPYAGRVFDEA